MLGVNVSSHSKFQNIRKKEIVSRQNIKLCEQKLKEPFTLQLEKFSIAALCLFNLICGFIWRKSYNNSMAL